MLKPEGIQCVHFVRSAALFLFPSTSDRFYLTVLRFLGTLVSCQTILVHKIGDVEVA